MSGLFSHLRTISRGVSVGVVQAVDVFFGRISETGIQASTVEVFKLVLWVTVWYKDTDGLEEDIKIVMNQQEFHCRYKQCLKPGYEREERKVRVAT